MYKHIKRQEKPIPALWKRSRVCCRGSSARKRCDGGKASARIHAEMSVFIKSGVTFAASLTHAVQPLIHSEWLDLSRKWDGGGRRKSRERAERRGGRSLRSHALLGARSKIKNAGWQSGDTPPGSGERRRSRCEGAWQRNKEATSV